MDDINFEELDKAVNSALQKPDNSALYSTDPVVKTSIDEVQTSQAPEPTNSPARPIVAKRRGQFMDMVHPSSDMTTATPTAQHIASPSRQRGTLQPLDAAIVETTAPSVTTMPEEEELLPTGAQDEVVPTETLPTLPEVRQDEWPDPLDVVDKTEQDVPDAQEVLETNYSPEQVTHIEAGFMSDDEEDGGPDAVASEDFPSDPEDVAQSSPFIDGPEVEKRPLGAFTGVARDNDAVTEPENIDGTTLEIPTPSTFPEELAPEVVVVESDEVLTNTETVPDQITNQEGMAASIPQQYKPTDDSLDNDQSEGHPVFDTKEYHQPLTPPTKKSKGGRAVRYILAVLLIVAFGVATGYIIWTFKLL